MTFDELVLLEQQLPRALASVKAFCDAKTTASLDRLMYLVSETRHAAYFLCDPECPERLLEPTRERFLRAAFNLPSRPVVEPEPTYTLAQIADACVDAEISSGRFESLEIALVERRKRYC